jgi:hypothetical protein
MQKFVHNLLSERWRVVLQSHKKLTRSAEILFLKIEHSEKGFIVYSFKCSVTHDYTFDDLKTERKAGIANFLSEV